MMSWGMLGNRESRVEGDHISKPENQDDDQLKVSFLISCSHCCLQEKLQAVFTSSRPVFHCYYLILQRHINYRIFQTISSSRV